MRPPPLDSRSLLGTGMDGTGGRDMMEIRCGNEKKKGIGTHKYPGNIGVVLTPATRSRLLIPPPPLPTPLLTSDHQPTLGLQCLPMLPRASRDIQPDGHHPPPALWERTATPNGPPYLAFLPYLYQASTGHTPPHPIPPFRPPSHQAPSPALSCLALASRPTTFHCELRAHPITPPSPTNCGRSDNTCP